MKIKRSFKRIMSAFLTFAIVAGMIHGGVLKQEAEACTIAYANGTVAYDIRNLRFSANTAPALFTQTVLNSGYNWNGIVGNNGVEIANIVYVGPVTNPGPYTYMTIRGQHLALGQLGITHGLNALGNEVANGANWDQVRITLSSNMDTWNFPNSTGGTVTALMRTARAQKTLQHEIGHSLKLIDVNLVAPPSCMNPNNPTYAVMHQGAPDEPSGFAAYNVMNHDRNTLKAKW